MGIYCVMLWTQNSVLDTVPMWVRWMFCQNNMVNKKRLAAPSGLLQPISLSQ